MFLVVIALYYLSYIVTVIVREPINAEGIQIVQQKALGQMMIDHPHLLAFGFSIVKALLGISTIILSFLFIYYTENLMLSLLAPWFIHLAVNFLPSYLGIQSVYSIFKGLCIYFLSPPYQTLSVLLGCFLLCYFITFFIYILFRFYKKKVRSIK